MSASKYPCCEIQHEGDHHCYNLDPYLRYFVSDATRRVEAARDWLGTLSRRIVLEIPDDPPAKRLESDSVSHKTGQLMHFRGELLDPRLHQEGHMCVMGGLEEEVGCL